MASHRNNTTFDGNSSSSANKSIHEEGSITIVMSVSFLVLLGVFIIVANAMVFILFAKRSYLRTKSNVFLVSLAASDFLAGVFCIPLVIMCNTVRDNSYSWMLCVWMDLSQRFIAISTILHLLAATLERYLKIVFPFRYLSVLTSRKMIIALCLIWFLSLFSSVIQLSWIDLQNSIKPDHDHSHKIDALYLLVCTVVFVLVPFLILVFAYLHIFYIIRGVQRPHLLNSTENARRIKRKKANEMRAACIYIAMVLLFLFAWSGYFLTGLVSDLKPESAKNFPEWLNILLMFLKFSTALVNPLLYTFFKADFQKALGSFKEHAVNTLFASAQFFSVDTFENVGIPNGCRFPLRNAVKGRSFSEPNCLAPKQKNTRSKSVGIVTTNV